MQNLKPRWIYPHEKKPINTQSNTWSIKHASVYEVFCRMIFFIYRENKLVMLTLG